MGGASSPIKNGREVSKLKVFAPKTVFFISSLPVYKIGQKMAVLGAKITSEWYQKNGQKNVIFF